MEIAASPSSRRPWGDAESPFDELGGDEGVRALAWAFYDVVEETSPVLTAMLGVDTLESRQKLYEFLSGWTGGPALYWERRGHPALRMRHAEFPIDAHAAEEWVRCLDEAMDRLGLEPGLRGFLGQELARAARQLQNRT